MKKKIIVEIDAMENYLKNIEAYIKKTENDQKQKSENELQQKLNWTILEASLLGMRSSLKLLQEKIEKLEKENSEANSHV